MGKAIRPIWLALGTVPCLVYPPWASAQTSVPAAVTPDASVTLTSDYRFRGVSRSDRDPAVQLTADLTHASGAYVGAFVSTIADYVARGANPEIDLYAGIHRPVAGSAVDAGLLYYAYPGANGIKADYFEPYASVSHTLGPASVKLGGNFSWRQSGLALEPDARKRSGIYTHAEATVAVPRTPVTLSAHVGRSFHATQATLGERYVDWSLAASYTHGKVTAALAYVDTDKDIRGYPGGGLDRNLSGAGVFASVSLAF